MTKKPKFVPNTENSINKMYAIFETSSGDIQNKGYDSVIKIDSSIQSLSWMSKTSIFPNSAVSASSTAAVAAALLQNNQNIADVNNNNANGASGNGSNNNNNLNSAKSANDDEIKFDKLSHYQVGKFTNFVFSLKHFSALCKNIFCFRRVGLLPATTTQWSAAHSQHVSTSSSKSI